MWVDYDGAANSAPAGIDLDSAPTFGEILQQLRGERIATEQPQLEGVVFGLEIKDDVTPAGQKIEQEYLTVLTSAGLKSVPLRSIGAVRLQDPKLQKQLEEALANVAASRKDGTRVLQFRFQGNNKRAIQIGYLRPTPVWKTSHRLILPANSKDEKSKGKEGKDKGAKAGKGAEGGKAQLQSWAIVENTGESDWKGVQLSLVSGSPSSFQMSLHAPRFLERPHVKLPFAGVPQPRLHEGGSALAPYGPPATGGYFGGRRRNGRNGRNGRRNGRQTIRDKHCAGGRPV